MARGKKNDGATVGYEAELWRIADALRGSMDAAECKHAVLGYFFLKYIVPPTGNSKPALQGTCNGTI